MDAWMMCWSCVSCWNTVVPTTPAGIVFKANLVDSWKRRALVNFKKSPAAKMTFFLNPMLWSSAAAPGRAVVYAAERFYTENGMGDVDTGRVDKRTGQKVIHKQTFETFKNDLQALAKTQLLVHIPPQPVQPAPAAVAVAGARQAGAAFYENLKRFERESSAGYVAGDIDGELAYFVKTRSYQKLSNVLDYYADCEASFPSVARLARRYLCIPSSNVASESLLSLAGYISEDERACASEELVETQLMIRRNHQECQNVKELLKIE
jgi:hypothetical protein